MDKLNMISAILKFINGRNKSREDLEDIINYTTDPAKTEGGNLVRTLGCSRSDPLRDIENNKMAWHKEGKQYEHFVLAFPPNGNQHSAEEILRITSEIVDTVYPEYMAVISVHTDSLILHAHVVLDALNAVTGKKFSQGSGDLNRVKQKVNGILKANGFEIIRMSSNDFVDHTDYSQAKGFDFLELDETELISERDVQSVCVSAEIIGTDGCLNNWSVCSLDTPIPYYSSGGFIAMNTTKHEVPAAQQPENPTQNTTAITLTEQAVPTAAAPSYFPTTTVVTGPTFRIMGTPKSDLSGLGELVTQSTAFAQEHQRDAANLALAMQVKAQEIGHPTNVSVIAGPVFDIDLTPHLSTRYCVLGDDGVEPYEEDD